MSIYAVRDIARVTTNLTCLVGHSQIAQERQRTRPRLPLQTPTQQLPQFVPEISYRHNPSQKSHQGALRLRADEQE